MICKREVPCDELGELGQPFISESMDDDSHFDALAVSFEIQNMPALPVGITA